MSQRTSALSTVQNEGYVTREIKKQQYSVFTKSTFSDDERDEMIFINE